MAGDWIKIERDLPHKPEVMRMAEMLSIDELQVVGHLVLFWSWCDANMSLDCPDVIGTKRGLDRASCRDGMVDALLNVGWLELVTEFGHECYRIPNFERHLSKSAKTRGTEQRKKKQQRSRPLSSGDKCPDSNGTTAGPEKRREEINIYTPGPDIAVNERINTSRVVHAVGRWINHLRDMDVKTGTTKAIELNSPQEQELWNMLALWRETPEAIELAISTAISGNWQNLRKPTATAKGKAVVNSSDDWIKALNAARSHPQDYETRLRLLGSELFEALKRTGTARVANANDYELKTLSASFAEHLKDLRNGTPVSN